MTKRKWIAVTALVVAIGAGMFLKSDRGRQTQFLIGGALVNLGYRMQDHLESYDFHHHEDIRPEDIWQEIRKQNLLASSVRRTFPRTARHPLVALVVCMDARLDTNELTGDTRKFYYIIRTAGSVLSDKEEEMLELAVQNGVKLIVWTTHTDCAAERAAASQEQRQQYPALVQAIGERETRLAGFLARRVIAERLAAGKLAVKLVNIDTMTERMILHE